MLLFCAILAFPAPWKNKLVGLLAGTVAVQGLNVIRVISLFYLGQALMQLNQPTQACKAYSELDAVYGAKIRPDLKKLEADAKSEAKCS